MRRVKHNVYGEGIVRFDYHSGPLVAFDNGCLVHVYWSSLTVI